MLLASLCYCQSEGRFETKISQISPLVSPGKKYTLKVIVIEENKNGFNSWWQIEIADTQNNILLLDKDSFPANFNIYWNWDNEERLWVYNSDDGKIYYWEFISGKWAQTEYDRESSKLIPAKDLLPVYEK